MENKTTLKQGDNTMKLLGIVLENNLVAETSPDGTELIKGNLVVSTGDNQEHTVKAYSKKFTTAGNVNPSYTSLSVALGYVSIASLLQQGMTLEQANGQATVILIKKGEVRLNTYLNPKKIVVAYPELFFSFIETATVSPDKYVAEFELEGVLENMKPEFDKDSVETGRYIIDLIYINYKGEAQPFSLMSTPEAGAYMSTHYAKNLTTKIWGTLISTVTKISQTTEGFANDKVKEFERTEKEMVICSGAVEQKNEENGGYSIPLIQKAMAERKLYIDSLVSSGGNKPSNNNFTAPAQQINGAPKAPKSW